MLALNGSPEKPANPPKTVIDLTSDELPVSIDLTTVDDSPPPSPRQTAVNSEPPRKRQRVSNGSFLSSKSRDLAACLKAQVKPYIDAALAEIPVDKANAYEIGTRVINDIGSTPQFSLEFTHKGGFLSLALERDLADKARDLVAHYYGHLVRTNPTCLWRAGGHSGIALSKSTLGLCHSPRNPEHFAFKTHASNFFAYTFDSTEILDTPCECIPDQAAALRSGLTGPSCLAHELPNKSASEVVQVMEDSHIPIGAGHGEAQGQNRMDEYAKAAIYHYRRAK
ncbi:WD repeat domain-containing protein [Colletotrichum graminicola]|nr:WD repeat domain-containing protein [Colletotrichum graminicola]